MTPPNLLLPERGVRRTPPKDRAIWMVANIIARVGCCTEVEPYEGFARWSETAQDWQDARGMSIRGFASAEVWPLDWLELHERAAAARPEELAITTDVRRIDYEGMPEDRVGFYADVTLSHRQTWVHLHQRIVGPFPSLTLALAAQRALLAELNPADYLPALRQAA